MTPTVTRSQRISPVLAFFVALLCACWGLAGAHEELLLATGGQDSRPEQVNRALSRAEIYEAICGDLIRQGIPAAARLRPEDLRIQLAVQVAGEDAGLQVKRVAFDPLRRETRFQLWAARDPGRLPFEVAISWDLPKTEPGGKGGRARSDAGGGVPSEWQPPSSAPGSSQVKTAKVRPVVLVRLGRPATLVMFGENVRVIMTVMPLATGSQGQRIRVRNPANAHILSAEVIAEGMLRSYL